MAWTERTRFARAVCVALMAGLMGASGAGLAQNPPTPSTASSPPMFKDADLPLGEKLIAQHKCSECHARKWSDDGNAIYRPLGRINTPEALRGMVDYCSTQLSLNLFPEEVDAIAAVLNRDHYRFKR